MSSREFRPKRWEQKANVRPGKRARTFRYTSHDIDATFEAAYEAGKVAAEKRTRRRDDVIRRLSDAAEKGQDAMEELARELDQEAEEEARWWSGDVDDLAREVGVLSEEEDKALWDSVPPHGSGMVIEIEQWLRDRDRWIEDFRDHGELPEDGCAE